MMVSVAAGRAVPVGLHRAPARWRVTGAMALILIVEMFSLAGLLQGAAWWPLMFGVGALILTAAALLRSVGVPGPLVPVLGLVLLIAVTTAIFGAGTGIAGVLPTPATFRVFSRLFEGAGASIAVQSVPAEPVQALLFLVAVGTGAFVLVLDTLAVTLRAPALCGVPMLVVTGVPAFFLTGGISPWSLVCCAAAYLYLLRVDVVTRRSGGRQPLASVSLGAASIAIALIVGATAPGFFAAGATSANPAGIQFAYGTSPLIDLGKDLRRPNAVTALSYSTTANGGEYLKLATLDQFTGRTWIHGAPSQRPVPLSQGFGPVPGLGSGISTFQNKTVVTVDDMQSPWLPVPYPATRLSGVNGSWFVAPDDRTVSSVNSGAHGQSYRVTSLVVAPTPDQLRAAGSIPEKIRDDLAIPRNLPKIIPDTARKVTAGANGPFEQAVALQNYFRSPFFQYSLAAPVQNGYDGDGAEVIAKFLQVKRGYCVHFAASMALMARTLGIPARIAIGYLPGTQSGPATDGQYRYTVSSDDLHAWPELYFDGAGWIPFEPTVSRGVLPGYTQTAVATTPNAAPDAASTPTTAPKVLVPKDSSTFSGATSGGLTDATAGGLRTWLIVVVAIALVLLPAAVRRGVRLRRRRQIEDGLKAGPTAWQEILDTARDLGWGALAGETPRAFAVRLAEAARLPPAEAEMLETIRTGVEQEWFGPPRRWRYPDARLGRDTTAVIAALGHGAPAVARVRAVLAPASLVPASIRRDSTAGLRG